MIEYYLNIQSIMDLKRREKYNFFDQEAIPKCKAEKYIIEN